MKIPDKTKIQSVDLRVKDFETSFDFYADQLGFKQIERIDDSSFLSANGNYPYIIKLTEDKNARARVKGSPGLYHMAFLFPDRKELARVFLRLFNNKIKFRGFSDHLVSEAIYLDDPDGNGVELYADKPKEEWVWRNGEVVMDSLPLDLSLVTNELDDREVWNGIHPDTFLGHIHLNVSDLRKAEEFYNEILNFNISNYSYPGAKFFSAGGYHHHIGVNTWTTNNKVSRNENSLGLLSFTINVPDKEFINEVKNRLQGTEYEIIGDEVNSLTIKDTDSNVVKIVS